MARRTRRDFFEYLDEFQLFVSHEGGSKTFSKILAEARKRHLYLILAHQQLSQLDEQMRGSLGNVGTLVCFGIDRSDAEIQAKRIFLPHGEDIKEKAKRDSQYPLYFSLYENLEKNIQALDKRTLSPRWAYVVSKQRKAALIKTIEVKDTGFSKKQLEEVKGFSVRGYGNPYNEVKEEIDRRYDQYLKNDEKLVKNWEIV
jgi:type IV secretory pathway VirB4 component